MYQPKTTTFDVSGAWEVTEIQGKNGMEVKWIPLKGVVQSLPLFTFDQNSYTVSYDFSSFSQVLGGAQGEFIKLENGMYDYDLNETDVYHLKKGDKKVMTIKVTNPTKDADKKVVGFEMEVLEPAKEVDQNGKKIKETLKLKLAKKVS